MNKTIKKMFFCMALAILGVTSAYAQYDNLYFDPEVDEEPTSFIDESFSSESRQYSPLRNRDFNRDNRDFSYADRISRFRRGSGVSYGYNNGRYNYPILNSGRVVVFDGIPVYLGYRGADCRNISLEYLQYRAYQNIFLNTYYREPICSNFFMNDRYVRRFQAGHNNRKWAREKRRRYRQNPQTPRQEYKNRNGSRNSSRYGNRYRSQSPRAGSNNRVQNYNRSNNSSSGSSRGTSTRKHNGRGGQ